MSLGVVVVFACGNTADDSADAGTPCAEQVTSSTDGTTTCGPGCPAGFHCNTGGDACLTGCTSTANCGGGEYCDLSGGTNDLEGTTDGVCRTPSATCTGAVTPVADASTGTTLDASAGGKLDAAPDATSTVPDTGPPADTGTSDDPCTELQACCRAITDVDTQDKCEDIVATVDTPTCTSALAMYEAAKDCP